MAYLIGTDEAGYGPNFGPLLIAATVWRIPGSKRPGDLYQQLQSVICSRDEHDERLVLADSKSLYQPASGVGLLETHVLAAAQAAGLRLNGWADAWRELTGDQRRTLAGIPWYRDVDLSLPIRGCLQQLTTIAEHTRQTLQSAGTAILRLQAAAMFPAEFNDMVDTLGNKASVLSHRTIQLVRELAESLDGDEPIYVHCDKHGGRNRYLPILQHFFPDARFLVVREGREQSCYRWSDSGRELEIRFEVKGERFPPSALASMIAKYLRELAMHAFNEFWKKQLPDLKPTAGYPVDAKRFRREISDVQRTLAISDRTLWRNR